MSKLAKTLSTPLRGFFNPRFEALDGRLQAMQSELAELAQRQAELNPSRPLLTEEQEAKLLQAQLLASIDLREHNASGRPATFDRLECQAASASQCDHPVFLDWCRQLTGWTGPMDGERYNRKVWEWAFICEAISQAGLMHPGRRAVGFGVGTEPVPALLASRGIDVVATDQGAEDGADWATYNELMKDLAGLARPHLLTDDELARRVTTREVDMNAMPDDLGEFDITWSSCVIEHLGSPQAGLDFVLRSCELLRPGGIAVHTTEMELTAKDETADYGHCAVYRISDFQALGERLADVGCSATFNFSVSMDTVDDRWVSLAARGCRDVLPDQAHLKLGLGDSVSTSYGLLIRKAS
jgi:hypothetical protein